MQNINNSLPIANTTNATTSVAVPHPALNTAQNQNFAKSDIFKIKHNKKKPKTPEEIAKLKKAQKIAGIAVGIAVGFTVFGALLSPRAFGLKISDLFQKGKKKIANWIQTNYTNSPKMQRLAKKLKEGSTNINFFNNFTNAKDAFPKKYLNKIKLLKRFDDKMSSFYINVTNSQRTKKAAKTLTSFDIFKGKISRQAKELSPENQQKIFGLLEKAEEIVNNTCMTKNLEERMSNMKNMTLGLDEKYRHRIESEAGGIIDAVKNTSGGIKAKLKAIFSKSSNIRTTFIAEDLIQGEKEALLKPLKEDRKLLGEILGQINDILGEQGKTQEIQTASKKLFKKFNFSVEFEDSVTDKIRDVRMGCAPMDAYLTAFNLGLVGVAVGQAKTKEKRRTAALTGGIPIATGMVATSIATMMSIAGTKALFFGLATSTITNVIGRTVDKLIKKSEGKDPDVPQDEDEKLFPMSGIEEIVPDLYEIVKAKKTSKTDS